MDWDQTPKKEVEPWEIPDRPIVRPGETSNTSAQYQQYLDGEREAPPKPRRRPPARQPRPKQSSAVSEVLRQIRAAEFSANAAALTYAVMGTLLLPMAAHRLIAAFLPFAAGAMAFDPETELLCGVLPVFFFLLALGLWRRSRFAALTGLVLSLAVLGSGLSELPEAAMLHLAAGGRLLPLSLFAVVAVLGAVGVAGAFRWHRLQKLVLAGEPLGARHPTRWLPRTAWGKVVFILAFLAGLAAAAALTFTVYHTVNEIAARAVPEEEPILLESEAPEREPEEFFGENALDSLFGHADPDGPDPAGWETRSPEGLGLSLPLPGSMEMYGGSDYSFWSYNGEETAFSLEVGYYDLGETSLGSRLYTEEELVELYRAFLSEDSDYEEEAVPFFTGTSPAGDFFGENSMQDRDLGYTYAARVFLRDDRLYEIEYCRYDLDGWDQSFEDTVRSYFDQIE